MQIRVDNTIVSLMPRPAITGPGFDEIAIIEMKRQLLQAKQQLQVYKPKGLVIRGQIDEPNLTADSVPNVDELGPDNYWGPGTYILWHQLNKQKYGQQIANAKMQDVIARWGTGGVEYDYCYDRTFNEYFTSQGVDVTTIFCSAVNAVTSTTQNLGDTAAVVTKTFKTLSPFLLVGGLIWAVDKYAYPIFPRDKKK